MRRLAKGFLEDYAFRDDAKSVRLNMVLHNNFTVKYARAGETRTGMQWMPEDLPCSGRRRRHGHWPVSRTCLLLRRHIVLQSVAGADQLVSDDFKFNYATNLLQTLLIWRGKRYVDSLVSITFHTLDDVSAHLG